jgi:hypothetical protein
MRRLARGIGRNSCGEKGGDEKGAAHGRLRGNFQGKTRPAP